MPGAFPMSPAPISFDLSKPTVPTSPPHSEGRGSDSMPSRGLYYIFSWYPRLLMLSNTGRGTPITRLSIHSPSPSRLQISRGTSPSLEDRARRHNARPSEHFIPSETSSETASDDGYIQVDRRMFSSPQHRYPPLAHRSFEPFPDLGVPRNRAAAESSAMAARQEELDRTPQPRSRTMNIVDVASPKPVLPPLLEASTPPRSYLDEAIDEALEFEEEMRHGREIKKEESEDEGNIPTRTASPIEDRSDQRPPPQRLASDRRFNPRGLPDSLVDRFPVMVVHAPSHQDLWDRLPVGTLFNVALVADTHDLDLEKVSPTDLNKLLGGNLALGQVEEILGVRNPSRVQRSDEAKVSEELDWEAEQIVSGSGEMLGWREDKGTRYGGKVQFAATLKLDENQQTRGEPFDLKFRGRLSLDPPCLRGSSAFTRTFGSHRFLRVKLSGNITREVSVWTGGSDSRREAKNNLKEWAVRPIFILGRVYSPLLEKEGVIIYFLEGRDLVGEMFAKGKNDYGIKECRDVNGLLNWWIPFKCNGDQGISKLVTRLELGVSDTLPGFFISPENIERVPDIGKYSIRGNMACAHAGIVNKDGKMFTDGAGLITPSIARSLMDKYYGGSSVELHVAYQVRIQTAKGVVLVDPVMLADRDFSKPHRIQLYDSMCKAKRGRQELRRGPVNGLHILDASSCILCIVKPAPSSSSQGARLSGQFITILSDCGVPNEILLKLQSDALEKELREWTEVSVEGVKGNMRLDEMTRLRIAKLVGRNQSLALMIKKRELTGEARGYGFGRTKPLQAEEEESSDEAVPPTSGLQRYESFSSQMTASEQVEKAVETWSHNEISGFPAFKSMAFQDALYAGIEVWKSRYWFNIWKDLAKGAMLQIVSKFHLSVEKSASGFFQPGIVVYLLSWCPLLTSLIDPTGLLKPGQVFFRPKEEMLDSTTGLRIDAVLGPVLVRGW